MRIGNARIFNGVGFDEATLTIKDGLIADISPVATPFDINAEGAMLVPGFIDIHTHGTAGGDASDGEVSGLERMSLQYAKSGVTCIVPSVMTLSEKDTIAAVRAIASAHMPDGGALCGGIHLEGPFLAPSKCGAQDKAHMLSPDFDFLCRLNELASGNLRMITLAPELEGAMEFIEKASELLTIALGHTATDYNTAVRAFDIGASHVTHLFNAMPSLHHRDPGLIGAAFDCGATVELICDGIHIHPSVLRAAYSMFGERCVFVSDSIRAASMPDGGYSLGGLPVIKSGDSVRTTDGALAGSVTNLHETLKNSVDFGISLEDALYALTYAPARAVGLFEERGSIDIGKRADFLLIDDDLDIKAVYIGGKNVGV